MGKKHENNQKPFKVPDDAKLFAKASLKKFQKHNDFYVDKDASKKERKEQKKELREAYYGYLFDLLPECIPLTVWYGNRDEVQEITDKIYEKICDPKFVKYIKKAIKNEEFKNMDLMPTMVYNIYHAAQDAAKQDKDNGEETEYDMSDLLEVSNLILKPKMKKLTKKVGISNEMAFDVLSVIPTPYILMKSSLYHMRRFMTIVYEYAKTEEFDFGKLVKIILKNKDNENGDLSAFILFLLLERKNTISKFNEKQKAMFSAITTWVFDNLEKLDKEDIKKILNNYLQARKKDNKIGKDENRRYRLKDVPAEDYPKIAKIVSKLSEIEENQKYI